MRLYLCTCRKYRSISMKLTKRKLSIIFLALALLISLTAFFGLRSFSASAEGTATVSNVFTATGDGISIVGKHKQEPNGSGNDGMVDKYYMTFLYNKTESEEEGFVYYKNRLAYDYFVTEKQSVEGSEDKVETVVSRALNLEIGFDKHEFDKFAITFEAQEYNKSKDGKTVNYIMFFPAENGVYALVTQDKDATVDDIDGEKKALPYDHIKIQLSPVGAGDYAVTVSGGSTSATGVFKNVGGTYAKAVTSGKTLVYPLIFSATFAEDAESAQAAMILYNLNGQKLASASGTDTGNGYTNLSTVEDTEAPALCFEEDVKFFTVGSGLDFDFTAVDVLRTSPSTKVYYYLLTVDQRKGDDKNYDNKELFTESDDDTILETNHDKYLPTADDLAGKPFDAYGENKKDFTADMLVKVYVNLVDYSSRPENANFHLNECLKIKGYSDYLVDIDGTDFMVVADDNLGARYNDENAEEWNRIVEEYQEKVTEAAKDLSAGSSSYLYLPSAETLFKDNSTSYEDLKLSIYYYRTSQESSTNLDTNNLSISIPTQGHYVFTLYATDASGNNMWYPEDGEVKTFAASEIWTMFDDNGPDGLYHKLPWFHFDVSYKGVEFEETPGMQSTAYVGSMYSSASFKINGISGAYDTVYKLYWFDRDGFYQATGVAYSYEEFIANMDKLFNNELFEDKNPRQFFEEIIATSDMEETDEEYEKYVDYAWNKTSTSFNPQKAGYYYMKAEVTDTLYNAEPVTCSLAVVASVEAKTIKGEDNWLQNNLASVILLFVAGLSLVGIILLLVIKPKDNTDIDVKFENEQKKSKKKNK